ncbi:MAG: methionyl-tRNA formyltransferase [Candidatus Aminicenantes bacterium]|nr:methionyl-tRNA formyltransferase [Candidatus Aminicenantes bacterium]
MTSGRIIFFGTSQVAIPFLSQLRIHFDISLIITQPDATGGRCRQVICPPVKSFAQLHEIPLEQPEGFKNQAFMDKLKAINPDIGVVIGYGKLIPERLFTLPRLNTVNVHFSLLPLYRGAAPVQRTLEKGETSTGISIFEISKKMDTGPIWSRKAFNILPTDTTETLMDRLSQEGAPLLVEILNNIFQQKIKKQPQDHTRATYAPAIHKQEGRVDWNQSATQIFNKHRAFTPWPGLFFSLNNRTIKIKKISPPDINSSSAPECKQPGEILTLDRSSLEVCCGNQTILKIEKFQPEGKKPMTPYCFSLGNPLPEKLN